jgi:hypothetical protein
MAITTELQGGDYEWTFFNAKASIDSVWLVFSVGEVFTTLSSFGNEQETVDCQMTKVWSAEGEPIWDGTKTYRINAGVIVKRLIENNDKLPLLVRVVKPAGKRYYAIIGETDPKILAHAEQILADEQEEEAQHNDAVDNLAKLMGNS